MTREHMLRVLVAGLQGEVRRDAMVRLLREPQLLKIRVHMMLKKRRRG